MAAVTPTMLAPMADTLDHRNMDFNSLELKRRTFMPVHAAVKVISTTVSAKQSHSISGVGWEEKMYHTPTSSSIVSMIAENHQ